MAITLTQALIAEKNKIESTGAWIVLVRITSPDLVTRMYLCLNTEDLTVNGQLYQAFPFEISDVVETSTGGLPSFSIKVSNIDRVVQSYIEQDATLGSGWNVTLTVISTTQLDGKANANIAPEIEIEAITLNVTCDKYFATFNCGVGNPMMRSFPRQKYSPNFCQRTFNDGVACNYSVDGIGSYTTCNKTVEDCQLRFGEDGRSGNRGLPFLAFKGIPFNAIR